MKNYPIKTLENITCPCCFESYPISELLIHDPNDVFQTVLPSRFTPNGVPQSKDGIQANNYVCPSCKFDIPLRFLEHPSVYISMVGAPTSGKTYYSVAMYREMLQLEKEFNISFSRADISTSDTLRSYYRKLFQTNENLVHLEKTQTNDPMHYHNDFPKPYIFEVTHPSQKEEGIYLNIYDQAGENWDDPIASSKKFGHLRHQNNIIFIFFDQCQDIADYKLPPWELVTCLKQRCERKSPKVFVIVTKLDQWVKDLNLNLLRNKKSVPKEIANLIGPQRGGSKIDPYNFDDAIESISEAVRQTLHEKSADCQRFLRALDDLSQDITFFPVSATGCSPERNSEGELAFKRTSLSPCWVRTPLVYALRTNPKIRDFLNISSIEMVAEE